MEVHEIKTVKFGGSPTDRLNKVVVPEDLHEEYTQWWKALQRWIEDKPLVDP
jgi:hypothetical protein